MKIINKTYEGAEGRRLLPVVRDDAGVSGDAFSTAIRFKLNSSYKNFSRYIEWEVVDPMTEEKCFYPLINDEHLIPPFITSVSKGKTVMYNLALRTKIEQGGFLVDYYEKSEPGAVYFAASNITPVTDEGYNVWFDLIEQAIRSASFNGKRTLTFTRIGGESFEVDLRDKSPWTVENESELELLVDAIKGDLCVTEDGYVFVLLNDHEPSVPGTWFKINQTKWKDIEGAPTDNELLDNILTLITGRLTDLEDGKLDKVTEPTTNEQAYIKGELGEQGMRDVSIDVVPDAIVRRDDVGKIIVRPPEDDDEAVSKLYVDEIRDYLQQQVDGTITAVQEGPKGIVSYFLTLTFSDGSTLDVPLGMADEEVAGMITAPAYETIFSNESRISSLEGDNFLYIDYEDELTLGMSSGDVMSRFETLFPSAVLRNGNLFENNNQSASYRWREDMSEWFPTVATGAVQLATQSIPGIVKGSYDLGQGYIEADGTISFKGWDNIPNEIGTSISTTRGVSTYTITLSRISKTTGLPGPQSALLEAASSTWSGLMTPAQFGKLANLPLDTNAVLDLKADKDAQNRMTTPVYVQRTTTVGLQGALNTMSPGSTKTYTMQHYLLEDSTGRLPFPTILSNTQMCSVTLTYESDSGLYISVEAMLSSTDAVNLAFRAQMRCVVSAGILTLNEWIKEMPSVIQQTSTISVADILNNFSGGRNIVYFRAQQQSATDSNGRMPFPDVGVSYYCIFCVRRFGTEIMIDCMLNRPEGENSGRIATSNVVGTQISAWREISNDRVVSRLANGTVGDIATYPVNIETLFQEMPIYTARKFRLTQGQCNLAPRRNGRTEFMTPFGPLDNTIIFVEITKTTNDHGFVTARQYASTRSDLFSSSRGSTGWSDWASTMDGQFSTAFTQSISNMNMEDMFQALDSNTRVVRRILNSQTDVGNGMALSYNPNDIFTLELYKFDNTQGIASVARTNGIQRYITSRGGSGWGPWEGFVLNNRIIQNTGTSVSDIMSQNAVTTALNGKASTTHQATHTTGTDQIPLGNGTVKGLSINDYTTTEKNKLTGIETGAQVNKIEEIKVNGITQPIVGKSVDIATSSNSFPTIDTPLYANAQRGGERSRYTDVHYNTPLSNYVLSCMTGVQDTTTSSIQLSYRSGGYSQGGALALVGNKLFLGTYDNTTTLLYIDITTNAVHSIPMPSSGQWGGGSGFAIAGNKLYVGSGNSTPYLPVIDTITDTVKSITMPNSGQWGAARATVVTKDKIFISASNQVAVIDINTDTVRPINSAFRGLNGGSALYKNKIISGTTTASQTTVQVIDVETEQVTTVNLGFSGLWGSDGNFILAGNRLFCSTSNISSEYMHIMNIDTHNFTYISMPFSSYWGAGGSAIVVGNKLYVGSITSINAIAVIDLTTNIVSQIAMPYSAQWGNSRGFALVRNKLYVTHSASSNNIAVIDTNTDTATQIAMPVMSNYTNPVLSGNKLYVFSNSNASYIRVIDTTTDVVTSILMPSFGAWGVANQHAVVGNKIYVGDNDNMGTNNIVVIQ